MEEPQQSIEAMRLQHDIKESRKHKRLSCLNMALQIDMKLLQPKGSDAIIKDATQFLQFVDADE